MVGFVVTLLTSIGSCGVSWIALRQAQQANTFQSAVLHQITARIADGKPSRLLSQEEYRPQEVDANFGPIHKIVGVQVEVQIINTGVRTFTIDNVDTGFEDGSAINFGPVGPPEAQQLYTADGQLLPLPVVLDPGHQTRFFVEVALPLTNDLAQNDARTDAFTSGSRMAVMNSFPPDVRSDGVASLNAKVPLWVAVHIAGQSKDVLGEWVQVSLW
jgi:hypothetical protein